VAVAMAPYCGAESKTRNPNMRNEIMSSEVQQLSEQTEQTEPSTVDTIIELTEDVFDSVAGGGFDPGPLPLPPGWPFHHKYAQ
jgi:hypothetical protein